MKKILVISNGTAGLYGFRREVLEALCQEHEVTVLAKDTGSLKELTEMGCKFIPAAIEYHGTNPVKELKLLRFYKKQIQEIQPDIVLTYTIKPNIYGGIACARLGIPYIANITGLGVAVENKGLLQLVSIPLYRYGLRKAQKVFFQNVDNMEFMRNHRMISGNYELLPGSGVNLDRYQVLEYPNGDTVDFVFIARIIKEKGIDQYLDAAKYIREKYPNTRFHICGGCSEAYKDIIKNLNESGTIVYHGHVSEISNMHKISQCTIHPTYYPEGMSNVLLESAAAAIQNFLLAAHEKGLGACWVNAATTLGYGEALRRQFAPDKGEFVSIISLGYSAQRTMAPPRKPGRWEIR